MSIYHKLCSFINKHALRGTKATWGLFILYALVIFITVMAAHWFFFHSVYISSLWKNTSVFLGFWLPKICISLFFAFFVLISKRKWWTVILLCIIDVWIIANLLYYRTNGYPLTLPSIMMASNLQGFESSIAFYWNWQCSFFLILTCLYAITLPFFQHKVCHKRGIIVTMLLIVITYVTGTEVNRQIYKSNTKESVQKMTIYTYIPFYVPQEIRDNLNNNLFVVDEIFLQNHSFIAYFPYIITSYFTERLSDSYIPTNELLSKVVNESNTHGITPVYSIVFILVESFENFALEVKDSAGNYYLPNLHTLTKASKTLHVDKLTSQARHGGSADGQMICNTGLLPIRNGTAAHLYNKNIYPNYAHFYDIATLSNPCTYKTWFQDILTYAYGYKEHLFEDKEMRDAQTFQVMKSELESYEYSLFCYFALTVDSHAPFNRVPHNPTLQFDTNMPLELQQYLTCLHYMDSCFGDWYNEWSKTEQAKNTILIITSDHTIFKSDLLQELMLTYAQQVDLSIASGKTYCPLIIQAPQIEENMQITDICYQMDVYPTIMHLIGCEDYYWKGFGVNLLDSTARNNRSITEEEAYQLSDKLIRVDYFRQIVDSLEIANTKQL